MYALYGFKFNRWWLYFSKYLYLIFTLNLSPTEVNGPGYDEDDDRLTAFDPGQPG